MTQRIPIPAIKLANVVPGAAFLSADEKGVNETFVGLVQTAAEQIRAYIKVLDGRQLVNEIVCTTFGRAVGLPIPEGFLLRVTSADLPESEKLKSHQDEALIFGSADAGHPSLKRRLQNVGDDFLRELFSEWKECDSTIIFDEWLANTDRHPGNLLIETPSKVWLIDHGHALTGPNWNKSDLVPDNAVQNKLADQYFNGLTLPQRMNMRAKAIELSKFYGLVETDSCLSAGYVNQLLNADDLNAVKTFIEQRVVKVIDLISSRLGIPNMEV